MEINGDFTQGDEPARAVKVFRAALRIDDSTGPLDLPATLECGQAFRWRPLEDGSGAYEAPVRGAAVRVARNGDALLIDATKDFGEDFWRGYFALDLSYTELQAKMEAAPELASCVRHAPGIRVLRQDFFETLLSFIISQNNNIPRIKGIIAKLCDLFGDELPAIPGGFRWRSFPSAERIASLTEDDIAPLKSGYRAPGILGAGRAVATGAISAGMLQGMGFDTARKELMKLRSVGPKVADCVLLFGLGRFESFPMDVWMRRAMPALFPNGLPESVKPFAGIAQQYIFHYARTGGLKELEG